ncbi:MULTISPECIES: hypothetical protein [unclassified Nocardia]|uniref:hypothetical protein n=1 Tax=unclassified Nocardia TaxID=2637762 RepID=UPI001CE3F4B4|nr:MULTISPECIES: hypothetical protein [unclassified Nocardia]
MNPGAAARLRGLLTAGAVLSAAMLSGGRSAAEPVIPNLPFIADIATGSTAPSAAPTGSAEIGKPLAFAPEIVSAAADSDSVADPGYHPIALGPADGPLSAACAGSAAAAGSALLLGSATGSGLLGPAAIIPGSAELAMGSVAPMLLGSAAPAIGSATVLLGVTGSAMTGSATAALLAATGSTLTGSGVPALLGSAATDSAAAALLLGVLAAPGAGSAAAAGSALVPCLLAVPVIPPTPGFPLVIPPAGAPPGAPVVPQPPAPLPAAAPQPVAAIPSIPAAAEPAPPVEFGTLELVTVLIVTIIAASAAKRATQG